MKWTTVRDDLGLQDHTFGRRVTSKINQLQKFESGLSDLQKELNDAEDEEEIEDLETQIETLKDGIKALNKELCGDMRRAHSNLNNQEKITSKLKKNGATTDGNSSTGTQQESPEGPAVASTNSNDTGAAPKTAGNQSPGTAQTATTTQTATTASSKTQKQDPAKTTKKKNTGAVVFFSIVSAALGFFIGHNSSK